MSNRRSLKAVLLIAAGMLSLSLAVDSFNWARATDSCGEFLKGPGTFTLDSDLGPCSSFGIEVTGPATLNMNGHTVSCANNSSSVGIAVSDEVTVRGGTVMNCAEGFHSVGNGASFVENMAIGNATGFNMLVTKGKLTRNQAIGNDLDGFDILGDSNTLEGNGADNNGGTGFDIVGNDNKLTGKNTADKDGVDGFRIQGNSNTLTKNTATNHKSNGFEIEGIHNKLTSNTSTGNDTNGVLIENDFNILKQNTSNENDAGGIVILGSVDGNLVTRNKAKNNLVSDLFDENGECTSNQWKKNKFGTKTPTCIH